MNVFAAVPVEESSQVAEARRAVTTLAGRLAFSETRTGQAALVATELATNLARHARHGEMLFRAFDEGTDDASRGIEIVSIDRGPGIGDVAVSRRDGFSTGGTLGHGLGAIERQADVFDLFTHSSGTAVVARIFRDPPRPSPRRSPVELGAVLVSKPGETVPGDAFAWRVRQDRLAILVADGLGHGLHAHEAAGRAVDVFATIHAEAPRRIIEDVHAGLRSTRGAAVATLVADLERGVIRYCGLGNISAHMVPTAGRRHTFVSQNGTAGHTAPRIQEFTYPLAPGALLVIHSDGLAGGWDLASYPGLRNRDPSVIAAVLYRDFSRRRDDVVIVVVRQRRI